MANPNFIAKIVPIRGVIVSGIPLPAEQLLGRIVLSENIVKCIQKIEKDEKVKAIIFEINSTGGMPYPVKEITDAIKKCKKVTVARIREYGTSGAYWVASACEKIVADPLSQIGGIGVRAERFDFSVLLEKLGIKIHQFTTGKYKGIGSPYTKITEEEKEYIDGLIATINQYFIEEIKKNRKIEDKAVLEKVISGKPYLGQEAKQLRLVDELGGREEALKIARQLTGEELEIEEYEEEKVMKPIQILGRLFRL